MTPTWWLQAAGKLYGPYSEGQLTEFLAQGRLALGSLMARAPEGPFAPAGTWPALAGLFAPPDPFAQEPPRPEVRPAAPAAEVASAVAGPAAERSLLVLAGLRDTTAAALEAQLLTFGACVRVKGTLWLCKARLPAAGLRNALSRRLGADEFLLVLEAEQAAAAWYNLDGETDRALRRLWAAGS